MTARSADHLGEGNVVPNLTIMIIVIIIVDLNRTTKHSHGHPVYSAND